MRQKQNKFVKIRVGVKVGIKVSKQLGKFSLGVELTAFGYIKLPLAPYLSQFEILHLQRWDKGKFVC